LLALDAFGCAVSMLCVSSPKLADASIEAAQADRHSLSARLTYLLESIAVIEIDNDEPDRPNAFATAASRTSPVELL